MNGRGWNEAILRGASLKEVQEILGHKTMTMTLRYAHLSQEHKKKAVNLLNGLTSTEVMSRNVKNDSSPASDLPKKERAELLTIRNGSSITAGRTEPELAAL